MTPSRARDRYLDTLRAVAIIRVIVYHMLGWVWLSYAYPAMGVMFALGGSLMAGSLQRSARRAVHSRIRRLLPALWVLGLVLVPVMIWHGWPGLAGSPVNLAQLVLWIVPVALPPGSAWANPATEVLWYLVAYLWFVLLSPLLWRAYRRWPVPTIVLPLVVLAVTQLGPWDLSGRISDVAVDLATFGACWIVGFAHRTGGLHRLRRVPLVALAAVLLTAGVAWALTHPGDGGSLDLNDIPLAEGLFSLGFVLVALRFPPPVEWLSRRRVLDGTVTFLNSRAVTVYLWHNLVIALSFPIGDALNVWQLGDRFDNLGYLAVAVVILTAVVLAVGWVEDVAARRRPQLLPVGGRGPGSRRASGVAAASGPAVAPSPPAAPPAATSDRTVAPAVRRPDEPRDRPRVDPVRHPTGPAYAAGQARPTGRARVAGTGSAPAPPWHGTGSNR